MENSLLYFFSTIPQVLAAVIALVFVFVLFRLQSLDKVLDALSTDFAAILGNNVTQGDNWQRLGSAGKFMRNYKSKYFEEISTLMDKICNERKRDNKNAVEKLSEIQKNAQKIESSRNKLVQNTKHLSLLGFSIIIISLSLIPFVKFIDGNCYLMNSLFLLLIVLTAIYLFWIYRILTISLN